MNRFRRNILVGVGALAVVWVLGLSVAHADMNQSLANMFNGWAAISTTHPGAYQSQTRGALMGGSLSLRIPQENFSLATVAPPRFKAGCQGIDMYLGSFSYGSLSRYVDLLQQLGTSAVAGFAFQLAMKELCEPCQDVLNKLEAAARQINMLGRVQPCQEGQTIGRALAGDQDSQNRLRDQIGDVYQRSKELGGAISDIWADRDTAQNQTTADAASAMAGTESDVTGNVVWKTLLAAGVDQDEAHLIMSVVGTLIVDEQAKPNFLRAVLTYDDLVEVRAGVDPVNIYVCDEVVKCLHPTVQSVDTIDGFRKRAEDQYQAIADKVLVSKLALAPSEVDFVNRSPLPVYRIIADYGHLNTTSGPLMAEISELLGLSLAYSWMEQIIQEADKHARNMGTIQPEFVGSLKEFHDELYRELRVAQERYKARMTAFTSLKQYVYHLFQVTKQARAKYASTSMK